MISDYCWKMNFNSKSIAFRININMNYRFDNDPHGDSKKSYFQINNGFEFDF